VHQVGKQDYIVLRCTVNNTLKFAFMKKLTGLSRVFAYRAVQNLVVQFAIQKYKD